MEYTITKNGDIYNSKGKKLKQHLNKFGYYRVSLFIDGKKVNQSVHRLVAKQFVKNPDNKPCVNHIDGCKTNNNYMNLEWVTNSENVKHAYKLGLNKGSYGEIHGHTKLKNEQIEYIYINPDKKTNMELANIFNVNRNVISKIWNHRTWIHITKDLTPKWRSLKNGKGIYEYRLP